MEIWIMSGAGNDFAVLDARGKQLDLRQLAIDLCNRYGTDGLLAADVSDCADFRLHFYNADGLRGEMCGNGARCICKFAFENGLAGETMTVQTDAGLICGQRLEDTRYRVKLNPPGIVDLHRRPDAAYIELGDPGIPHSVTEIPGMKWEDREALLPRFLEIRHGEAFSKGVNVNFYTRLSESSVRILTYERGVEDFTLACGTGSACVAVVLYLKGLLPGNRLIAENPGGTLEITLGGDGNQVTELYLEGPAVTVAKQILKNT